MKLSTAIHHYGAEALLYELFKVFPSNKKDLYQELQKLLNMRSGKGAKTLLKSFNKGELSLMIPANGETDCREFDVTVEPPKTDTPRDKQKCPSYRGVRLIEVLKSIDIRQKELKVQLIVVGQVLLNIKMVK